VGTKLGKEFDEDPRRWGAGWALVRCIVLPGLWRVVPCRVGAPCVVYWGAWRGGRAGPEEVGLHGFLGNVGCVLKPGPKQGLGCSFGPHFEPGSRQVREQGSRRSNLAPNATT
jgi:hypothetical protein